MIVEHGKIEDHIIVDRKLTLHGMVTGNVTVVPGGVLVLHGMCCQSVVVERGAAAYLHGTVGGDVLNRGGHLEVFGIVGGRVRTTERGHTFVDPGAVASVDSNGGGRD